MKPGQEKAQEREVWLKLMVKIIRWKEQLVNTDKITGKEWDFYYKSTIKTNTSYAKSKVLSQLEETKELIQKHGGFID
jgi:hypothetical protein